MAHDYISTNRRTDSNSPIFNIYLNFTRALLWQAIRDGFINRGKV